MDHDDIRKLNRKFSGTSPSEIVKWAAHKDPEHTIVSSNFRPQEAVLLHMAVSEKPDIPVLWADSGYNTKETYECAFLLKKLLNLNLKIYVPATTVAYRDILYGGIPQLEDEGKHNKFTFEVKLEPFRRGLSDLKPNIWLTALRREQTEFRAKMEYLSFTKNGILKVCPLLDWTYTDMESYLRQHKLPSVSNYFDPTKSLEKRECGLHPGI